MTTDHSQSSEEEQGMRNDREDKAKDKEKEKGAESKMPLDLPGPQGAPMDIDRTGAFIDLSDDDDDSFGSLYDMAAESDDGDLMAFDTDEEPGSPNGTNVPHPSGSTVDTLLTRTSSPAPPSTLAPSTRSGPRNVPQPSAPPSSTVVTLPTRATSPAPSSPQQALSTRAGPIRQRSLMASAPTQAFSTQIRSSEAGRLYPPVTRPALESNWQRNLLSSDLEPPPLYTPRTQALCVVCNEKPAFNDGRRAFPTCGNTCARVLEAAKKSSRNGVHSQGPYSAAVTNGHRHPASSSSSWHGQTRQTTIKMCEVCCVRPRCQKNGKIFPTCGLTCAAKLQSPGSVQMCEFCGERPRVVLNGTKFPHCGATCRDKAKKEELAGANSATCKTCLICWQKDKMSDENDFCSDACVAVVVKKAPFLLEVPRGHAAFKTVSDRYTSEWKDTQKPCPGIKKVYMVVMKPDFAQKYEQYRASVAGQFFKRNGNEKRVWVGIRRECGFGDAGNMEPCSAKGCLLCGLIRSSVSKGISEEGIMTTLSLARALEVSSHRKKNSKVVLMANVLLGREIELTKHEAGYVSLPPQGYESVHLIEYKVWGGKVDNGESLVFDGDAIKPLYLITFE